MAEAVFRHQIKERGLEGKFKIDSAGTGGWHHGEPPHHGTQKILKKNGISFDGQTARKLKASDFEEFDYIIAMDNDNQQDILDTHPKKTTKNPEIKLLLEYCGLKDEVPDPYYTGKFEEVFELIFKGCEALLSKIYPAT